MSFFSELCRRNVIRVAVVYAASSWLLLQILDLVIENSNAPEWVLPVLINVIVIGLPLALIAAWMLELTPDGIRLVKNVDPADSISNKTGRQLMRGIIMILAMAIVFFLTDRFRDDAWFGTGDAEIEQHNPGISEECASADPSHPGCSEEPEKDKG
mgnify:CR=1 FL=1